MDEKQKGKRTVGDETAKVPANNAMPGWSFALIKLSLCPWVSGSYQGNPKAEDDRD